MSNTIVRVAAPSRLHFGMISFGQRDIPAFGGVGVMLERPGLVLEVHASDQFRCQGPLARRAERFARLAAERWRLSDELKYELRVIEAQPQHVGLGTGTQLAMAVAAGLNCFLGRADLDAIELARAVGRGQRSAVGSHGFLRGGLIVDPGRLADAGASVVGDIPAVVERVAMPESWRFVLLRHPGDEGRHGDAEESAFAIMPPVPRDVTARLQTIVRDEMRPAADSTDCERFGDAVYEFGRLAGTCFASQQSGAFASGNIAHLIGRLRESGCRGVGQSSWGPTVFALAANDADAERIVARARQWHPPQQLAIAVSAVSNQGATIERKECPD